MINGVQRYTFEIKKFRFYITKPGFYEIILCFINMTDINKDLNTCLLILL